jgi:large subunit ribosomal protein L15
MSDSVNDEQGSAKKQHVLKVHHLRPAPGAKTAKTRVGRGEGSKGKTAGRGTKGQKAKTNIPARFEGGQMPLHMRLPKLGGFKNPFKKVYAVVNLTKLNRFEDGATVELATFATAGLARGGMAIKVLGTGTLRRRLDITAHAASETARAAIEARGGRLTIVGADGGQEAAKPGEE